jgi:hypothetical protein
MVFTVTAPLDLLTVLSLLFFYHKLAAKNRNIQMKDGGKISMDGLVNESHNNDGLIENERQSFEYEEFNTE